jgi:hypothetical protein
MVKTQLTANRRSSAPGEHAQLGLRANRHEPGEAQSRPQRSARRIGAARHSAYRFLSIYCPTDGWTVDRFKTTYRFKMAYRHWRITRNTKSRSIKAKKHMARVQAIKYIVRPCMAHARHGQLT